jgi:hypothetical protein
MPTGLRSEPVSAMRPCSCRIAARSRPWLWAALALVAVISTDLIDYGADHLRNHIFNASSASSWSHHADAAALAVGSMASLLGAWRSAGQRHLWAPVAAILALLFLDEVSPLHARIDQLSYGKLLYAPVLIVLVGCVWRLSTDTDEAVVVRAALATLAVSYAIHILGPHADNALGWHRYSWPYQLKVGLKEGTELAGLVVAVWALCRLASPLPARG